MRTLALAGLLAALSLAQAAYDAAAVSGEWMIAAYRATLSPLQGPDVCNFQPTCSQFTRAAIGRSGLLTGSVIGADRLLRDHPFAWSHTGTYYPGVAESRILDPVENHLLSFRPASRFTAASHLPNDLSRLVPLADTAPCQLADRLYAAGNFEEAAVEYLRDRFGGDGTRPRSLSALMAAESFLASGRPNRAAKAFMDADGESLHDFVLYGLARTHFAARSYALVSPLTDSIESARLGELPSLLAGWSLLRTHDFASAALHFSRAGISGPAVELGHMDGHGLARRSRLLGSLLSSVVPGLGQVYSGRIADGVCSFAAVSGIGLAAWWFADDPAHRDRTRVKFSLLAALGLLFHAGNIYGANLAARDYNDLADENYARRADDLVRQLNLAPDYRLLPDTAAAPSDTLSRPGN
jgi:putative component of membrane protein insertase Oxa1/YidC/SpoIIIJ protein YidD